MGEKSLCNREEKKKRAGEETGGGTLILQGKCKPVSGPQKTSAGEGPWGSRKKREKEVKGSPGAPYVPVPTWGRTGVSWTKCVGGGGGGGGGVGGGGGGGSGTCHRASPSEAPQLQGKGPPTSRLR